MTYATGRGDPARISGRSDYANAIRYALSRWDALTLILRDGRACIAFVGSNAAGERAAAIYSLVETARLHGFDPQTYWRHLLERIADYPVSRVGDLLPWNTIGLHPRLDQRMAALAERYTRRFTLS